MPDMDNAYTLYLGDFDTPPRILKYSFSKENEDGIMIPTSVQYTINDKPIQYIIRTSINETNGVDRFEKKSFPNVILNSPEPVYCYVNEEDAAKVYTEVYSGSRAKTESINYNLLNSATDFYVGINTVICDVGEIYYDIAKKVFRKLVEFESQVLYIPPETGSTTEWNSKIPELTSVIIKTREWMTIDNANTKKLYINQTTKEIWLKDGGEVNASNG